MSAVTVLQVLDVVVFFHGAAKIHGGKQGKYIRLQQSHKQLQKVHKNGKCYTYRPDGNAFENKD